MLKYSTLILLIAVAISWSCVDANPMPKAPVGKRSLEYKRSSGDELSIEARKKAAKELFVGLLMLSTGTSAEARVLSQRFKEAIQQKWNGFDDFTRRVVKIYEEVTGHD